MAIDLQETGGPVINFGIDESVIESVESRLIGLRADTPANYELVKAGKAEVRKLRTGVDAAAKALKKPYVEAQKLINERSRAVIGRLRAIEDPLDAEIERVEAEKLAAAKARAAEEEAKREAAKRKLQEEEDRQRAEEKRKRAEEERKRAEEFDRRKAELTKQRRELEWERAELEAERDAIAAEKRAAKESEERVDRERKEEERRKQQAIANEKLRKQREAEASRLAEERKPDREKLANFADKLEEIPLPPVSTDWGRRIVGRTSADLKGLASKIRAEVTA